MLFVSPLGVTTEYTLPAIHPFLERVVPSLRIRWIPCFFPIIITLQILGTKASQRVVGAFSAMTNGRCVRKLDFRQVR